MTPDERQLIADLFERMRATPVDKDREAEAFINQLARSTPDSAYKLVQNVLIQEGALQDAAGRIEELEAQVAQLQDDLAGQRPAATGGSFLGRGQPAQQAQPARAAQSFTPQTGARSSGFGQQPAPAPQASTPWGRPAQPQQGYPQQQPMQQPAQAASGGSFFRTAAATMAGVAGGVLAAGAIKDMFGGGSSAHAAGSQPGDTAGTEAASPYEVNANDQSASSSGYDYQSADNNDPGNFDDGSSADSGSWGGDDGSSM